MRVHVNGEARELAEASSVEVLLESLRLPRERVAVERNRVIVPRARFAETRLEEGDRVEIVRFVGGG
jgi:sulfur carrier protein